MTNIPEISQAEFLILRVIWKNGWQSVREVHDALTAQTRWAYTTTKTTMDRMAKKGLLQRDSLHGIYVYNSMITKTQGLVKWVRFFANSILETDYSNVVTMLGKTGSLSREETDELRLLLEMERETDD